MPTFSFTSPDGKSYDIEGPEGATQEQAFGMLQQHLSGQNVTQGTAAPQQTQPQVQETPAQAGARKTVAEMGGGQRFLAGVGMGMSRIGRGVGQAVGLVSQNEINQRHQEEQPLAQTGWGKAGNIAGTIATLAPTAFIPGANSLAGASTIGAGTGLVTTEGNIGERLNAAKRGAIGAAGGVLAARALGVGLSALGAGAEQRAAENAVTNNAIRDAGEAGYVLPPSEMVQSGTGRFAARSAESLAGKAATAQTMLKDNQQITNGLVRSDLGLAGGGQISRAELDRVIAPNLNVYREAAAISPEAQAAVRAWRDANDLARRYTREFNTNYTVAAEDAATAARAQAATHLQTVEQEALAAGQTGLAQRLANARVNLGRIGTVENAINEETGNVSAVELAKALDRGVPLTGGMERAAKFATAFRDYARPPKGMPGVSKLDAWTMAGGLASVPVTHGAGLGVAALPVISYGVRNALGSGAVQALARPGMNAGQTTMEVGNALINNPAIAGVTGNALSRRKD